MNLKSLRNKPSRNGFDLSFKRNFTAKAGELLPVMVKEVLPGDVFNINLSSFTRTQPINTAAFARMREYYDFFFVPYNLLWNKSDTVLTQMYDNPQHAPSVDPGITTALSEYFPYISAGDLAGYLEGVASLPSSANNYFGYSRSALSAKLFEYLGYGNYYYYLSTVDGGSGKNFIEHPLNNNLALNLFPLLAYQKIYSDFYRDSQWEKSSPSSYNVDYMTGAGGSTTLNIMSYLTDSSVLGRFLSSYNLFDLRYCNWQKDLFHGVVPQAQYGSTSVYDVPVFGTNDDGTVTGAAQLNILMLRQYEFLQKWKEIAQSGNKDYKDQVQKHWNVSVGDYASEVCQYLGGVSSNIDINEVVNTNITGSNSADIAGKGTGVSRGDIRFDSRGKYGVLMCIYHCLPVLDYTTDFVDPFVTKVKATDIAIPEFDKIGMQGVPVAWLMNPLKSDFSQADLITGYAPRYVEYKTSFDSSVGGFKRDLNSWVMSYDNDSVISQIGTGSPHPDNPSGTTVGYTSFKVNPNSVDPLFAVNADSKISTDQFLCSCFFDIKAVRNLDADGLPY